MKDFAERLEDELKWRYAACDAVVTPDTILLAVLNAVAAARLTPEQAAESLGCDLTDKRPPDQSESQPAGSQP